MSVSKNPKVDLKLKYKRVFETSIILSLLLITLAFKFFPNVEKKQVLIQDAQPLIKAIDAAITSWDKKPPVPPKPPIPIEAPSDDVLIDVEIAPTGIDDAGPVAPPPPKPAVKKVEVEDTQIFIAVEEMPEPIGGIQAIQNMIVYPEIARRVGIEGRVFINAFVDENGNVFKTEILKGIGGGCDEAAQSAVSAAKFKPGRQRGKAVKVQVSVPVLFKLQ